MSQMKNVQLVPTYQLFKDFVEIWLITLYSLMSYKIVENVFIFLTNKFKPH